MSAGTLVTVRRNASSRIVISRSATGQVVSVRRASTGRTLTLKQTVGPTGPIGITPNITVGTVTTGAAGSAVAFTLTRQGTTENYTLDVTIPQGVQGIQGNAGWSPVLGYVSDGDRRVAQLIDWTGGAGSKPAITSGGNPQYLGAAGFTTNIASAIDMRGEKGWSPVLALVANGADKRVQQLVDWIGGAGTKPAILSGGNPLYVGTTGFVTDINTATAVGDDAALRAYAKLQAIIFG